MSAWQIPLAGIHPQFTDPLTAQQRGLNLQQLAGQVQIQKQIQAENSLKIQAAQEDENDQKYIQDAFHDPSNADEKGVPDYEKIRTAIAPKVRLRNLQNFDADHLKIQQAATSLATSQNELQKTKFQSVKQQNEMTGQQLAGILQAPPAQKQAMYDVALTNLKAAGVDVSQFPPTVPDDDTLRAHAARVGYIGTILTNADRAAQEEQRKASAERAAAQARRADVEASSKELQGKMEDAARDHLGVTSQEQHDAWLAGLDPDVAKRFANLKTFNDDSRQTIQDMALTAQQRQLNADKRTREDADLKRAAVAGGEAGLASRATDPTGTEESRQAAKDALALLRKNRELTPNAAATQARFNQREIDADMKSHTQLREAEVDQWATRQRLGNGIADAKAGKGVGPNKNMVADPKSATGTLSIADATAAADAARDKAIALQEQQKQLRTRHQWGEFAPGQQQQAQPTAQPLFTNPNTPKPSGQVQPGNIDLTKLPVIDNGDGSYSTVYSTSFYDDKKGSPTYGKEVMVRGILGGKKTDDIDALKAQYYKDGQTLGVFSDGKSADAYGQKLHSDWESGKIPGVQMGRPAVQPGQKKLATMDQVRRYAAKNNMTEGQARKAIEAQGYSVQ